MTTVDLQDDLPSAKPYPELKRSSAGCVHCSAVVTQWRCQAFTVAGVCKISLAAVGGASLSAVQSPSLPGSLQVRQLYSCSSCGLPDREHTWSNLSNLLCGYTLAQQLSPLDSSHNTPRCRLPGPQTTHVSCQIVVTPRSVEGI